uniref:Ig-like domain-containing protein n=1 Tax=Panagrolaimus sp. PS1159 TaxID=55785 RepID=A0AC35FVR7_9BILA
MQFLSFFIVTFFGISKALGPPKLTVEPPDEVWFEPAQKDDFVENKLTLRCEADGDPESFEWRKNNEKLEIDGKQILWQNAPDSPPKLTVEPPDEVWFEPAQIDDFVENKLTLRCEADG